MFDRTITPESLIETKGLRRAAVLAALYNAASKVGHGEKNPGPATMTEAEAVAILRANEGVYAFDYLNGKRLKIDLMDSEADGIVAGQYDYGQGHGTAKKAIEILRRTGNPCHPEIIGLQQKSKVAAIRVSTPLPSQPRYGFEPTGQGTLPFINDTLADALELTDRSTPEEPDISFQELKKAPCITINL